MYVVATLCVEYKGWLYSSRWVYVSYGLVLSPDGVPGGIYHRSVLLVGARSRIADDNITRSIDRQSPWVIE